MLTAAITSTPTRRVGSFGRLIPGRSARDPRPCRSRAPFRGYDRPADPPVPVLTGVVALGAGWWLLRSMGPRARVGRILAATPLVEVGKAVELASAREPRYGGVGGRLDAEEPWEDESGQPLVFRRSTLERRNGDTGSRSRPSAGSSRSRCPARSSGSRSMATRSTTG